MRAMPPPPPPGPPPVPGPGDGDDEDDYEDWEPIDYLAAMWNDLRHMRHDLTKVRQAADIYRVLFWISVAIVIVVVIALAVSESS